MAFEFRFPDVGEGITEGEIVKWRVKEGDAVKEHDVIAEVETDKAVVEIPSPVSGTVSKLHYKVGDTVEVGKILASIETGAVPPVKEEKKDRSVAVVGELEEAGDEEPAMKKPSSAARPSANQAANVLALPAVRKFAEQMGVDLSKVRGSGPNGLITEKDVRQAALFRTASMSETLGMKTATNVERVPLRGIRKVIAQQMTKSEHTAVHVSHFDEADVTGLVEYREKEKKKMESKGLHLTYMPFIIRAVVKALKAHPYLNATLDDEKEEILIKKYYNIGVAVDTPEGLIVPNIKGADRKGIEELTRAVADISNRARERKIGMAELRDGTFTITNIGVLGGTHFTPIINWPEVAILGTGAIKDMPVVENGKIVARKMLPISISFDHRVLDGAEAARFSTDFRKYLENVEMLLKEDAELPKSSKAEKEEPKREPKKDDELEGII